MEQNTAYRPAKPRFRPLSIAARRYRAALLKRRALPGQIFTDWAAI